MHIDGCRMKKVIVRPLAYRTAILDYSLVVVKKVQSSMFPYIGIRPSVYRNGLLQTGDGRIRQAEGPATIVNDDIELKCTHYNNSPFGKYILRI